MVMIPLSVSLNFPDYFSLALEMKRKYYKKMYT